MRKSSALSLAMALDTYVCSLRSCIIGRTSLRYDLPVPTEAAVLRIADPWRAY
jgi:hypothetical protein